ncbi:Rho GTPase activation protein [Lipomyces japonicus]|uniref:Rho GTPase activation protein n=1 Tax=Lipomyces japonicus TaxID=56871 RepID=UPI0034CF4E5B
MTDSMVINPDNNVSSPHTSPFTRWWRTFKSRRGPRAPSSTPSSTGAVSAVLTHNISNTNSGSPSSSDTAVNSKIDDISDEFIFGVPLGKSLQYASATIYRKKSNGDKVVFGPIPVIVAECGMYLQEKAQNIQGIFRLSGSAKRIRELQRIFSTGPEFGKQINWSSFTVHDVASVFRRYLNNLPEPIIPLENYDEFRAPFMAKHEPSGARTPGGTFLKKKEVVLLLQSLIDKIPAANRQLLLYVLDLLDSFAKHSKKTLMPSSNLAAVFQPCILSHPNHNMAPDQYEISQEAIVFMIEQRKHFAMADDSATAS